MGCTRSVGRRHADLRTPQGERGTPLPRLREYGERTHLAVPISIGFIDCLHIGVVELRKEESVEIELALSKEWDASEVEEERVRSPLCIRRRLACMLRTKAAYVEFFEGVVWLVIGVEEMVL